MQPNHPVEAKVSIWMHYDEDAMPKLEAELAPQTGGLGHLIVKVGGEDVLCLYGTTEQVVFGAQRLVAQLVSGLRALDVPIPADAAPGRPLSHEAVFND